jgi:hypothetical protein
MFLFKNENKSSPFNPSSWTQRYGCPGLLRDEQVWCHLLKQPPETKVSRTMDIKEFCYWRLHEMGSWVGSQNFRGTNAINNRIDQMQYSRNKNKDGTVNMEVQMPLQHIDFIPFGYIYPVVGLLGHIVLYFNFLRSFHIVFHNDYTNLHSHQ